MRHFKFKSHHSNYLTIQKKKKKFKIVWIVYVNVQIHCKIELLVNLFLLNKISYSKDTIGFWFGESNKSLQSQIFENMMLGI